MVTTVNRNPMRVGAAGAGPTYRASVVSLSAVEKTPESAMTAAPHTKTKATRMIVGAAKKSGEATQQEPLITSATSAAGGRPKRSDAQPPRREPTAPATPIAANAMKPVDAVVVSPRASWPAATNMDSHVHSA